MTVPIKKAVVCKYCPGGSGIIWYEQDIMRKPDGSIICRKCVEKENIKLNMRVLGRNHPMIKDHLQREQEKIDSWNKCASDWNRINKSLGGKKNILELRKNPYLS
jgi:superfamily II helicase